MFLDTPGYGVNVNPRHARQWALMVKEYLRDSVNLRMALLLMDINTLPNQDDKFLLELLTHGRSVVSISEESVVPSPDSRSTSYARLIELCAASNSPMPVPILLVLTKDDRVEHPQRVRCVQRIQGILGWQGKHVNYSIRDRRGRGHMLRHVMSTLFSPHESLLWDEILRRKGVEAQPSRERMTAPDSNQGIA